MKDNFEQTTETPSNLWSFFFIPYIVLGILYLPMYLGYCSELWNNRDHYQFFPFLLAAVGFLIYERWPKGEQQPLRNSFLSPVLFVASALMFLAAILFSDAAIAAFGFALGVSSFLLRIKDVNTGGSLFPISLLLYIIVHAPFGIGLDGTMIGLLQVWSAKITSIALDAVGILHDMPGTVLVTSGKTWGVEEACSGVQSFFTLLFCSSLWVVWNRRPTFRGIMLVLSSVMWAIAMNSIRIFVIPFAYVYMNNWDLSVGWQHAALGYMTLLIGVAMIASTDQLLDFLFGPLEIDRGDSEQPSGLILRIWNRFIAGGSTFEPSGDWSPSLKSGVINWLFGGLAVVAFLFFLPTLYTSLTSGEVSFHATSKVIQIDPKMMPETIGDWKQISHTHDTRKHGSDLGQRSESWVYSNGRLQVNFSLDQVFPGWHELTRCYQNSQIGWQVSKSVPRTKHEQAAVAGDSEAVSWVQVGFESPTIGGFGYLYFGLDGPGGNHIDAPGDWSIFTSTWKRLMNRMSPQVRSRIFSGAAYQTQLFATFNGIPDEKSRAEMRDLYLALRQRVQEKLSIKRGSDDYMTADQLSNQRLEEKALKEEEDKRRGQAITDAKAGNKSATTTQPIAETPKK